MADGHFWTSWKPEHWIAAVGLVSTFAAGVAGAWLGGHIATTGARDLQERQQERASRAAARLFVGELARVHDVVVVATSDACWWKADYELHISTGDRALLAAGLNRDQWSQVVDISNGQDWLQVERSDGFQWQAGRPSPDMDVVVRALVGTRTLADKLGEFADMKTPALRPEPPLALAYRKVRRAPAHAFRNAACRDGAT